MGVKLGLPAQDDDIDELFSQSTFIEPNLDRNKLRKRMPSQFTPSFPSTATVHTMLFRFESALMNPATIVLSTRLGFPRKCLKSSLFYHYLYWINQKSIIRSLVIFSESLLTVVVAIHVS